VHNKIQILQNLWKTVLLSTFVVDGSVQGSSNFFSVTIYKGKAVSLFKQHVLKMFVGVNVQFLFHLSLLTWKLHFILIWIEGTLPTCLGLPSYTQKGTNFFTHWKHQLQVLYSRY